jgi:hypothetical protein
MAFRFRLLLAAVLFVVGIGCRKPLAPSADNNAAPETWITAAPQDTITIRDASGLPVTPVVGQIAFRFHLYWAGSDHDGDVRGFYFAVTETINTPGVSTPAPLPGPKPYDYHYTTKTDSVFIFNVFEESRSRRHAFYIYSVDDKGKPDATPARFIFDALDNFPPITFFTESYGAGYSGNPANPAAPPVYRVFALSDTATPGDPTRAPRDTVPSGSKVAFRWRGDEQITNNPAVRYKYKMDESSFIEVPATTDSVAYPPERVGTGLKLFEIRALDVAGASRTDKPTTRYFVVDFNPDTWYSGPDPSVTGFYQSNVPNDGQKFRNVTNWTTGLPVGGVPGSYFGPDSLQLMPKNRTQRKTFFEIYKNRLYIRAENDTVNLNSWIVFFAGGYDPDSPYKVRVDGFKFDTTAGPVLQKRPPNGSPVGFRVMVPIYLYPTGPLTSTTQSIIYPLDEALNVPEAHIQGYVGVQSTGRAYAVVRAVDGDGRPDDRIQNPKGLVDSLEAGILPPSRVPLRSRVLTFYINRAPYLQTYNAAFRPRPGEVYTTREIGPFNWGTYSVDEDPYEQTQREVGGPPPGTTTPARYRYTISLRGATPTNPDTVYTPTVPAYYRSDVPPPSITVPGFFSGPDLTLQIELCDYPTADFIAGQGRCRYYSIPIKIPVTVPGAGAVRSRIESGESGPGSSGVPSGGSQ